MAQSNWEADKMLDVYIYDYLCKRGLTQSVNAFRKEANVSPDPVAINATGGFLYEWWSVFWDIFIARTNEKHSEVAASYIQTQQMKAREHQQQLLLQQHQQQQIQKQQQQQLQNLQLHQLQQQQMESNQQTLQKSASQSSQQQQHHLQVQQQLQLQQRREAAQLNAAMGNGMPSNGLSADIMRQTAGTPFGSKVYEERMKQNHLGGRPGETVGSLQEANLKRQILASSTGNNSGRSQNTIPGGSPGVSTGSQGNKPGNFLNAGGGGGGSVNQITSSQLQQLKGWSTNPSSGNLFQSPRAAVAGNPNNPNSNPNIGGSPTAAAMLQQKFQMLTAQQQQQFLQAQAAIVQQQQQQGGGGGGGGFGSSPSPSASEQNERRLRQLLQSKGSQQAAMVAAMGGLEGQVSAAQLGRSSSTVSQEILMKLQAQRGLANQTAAAAAAAQLQLAAQSQVANQGQAGQAGEDSLFGGVDVAGGGFVSMEEQQLVGVGGMAKGGPGAANTKPGAGNRKRKQVGMGGVGVVNSGASSGLPNTSAGSQSQQPPPQPQPPLHHQLASHLLPGEESVAATSPPSPGQQQLVDMDQFGEDPSLEFGDFLRHDDEPHGQQQPFIDVATVGDSSHRHNHNSHHSHNSGSGNKANNGSSNPNNNNNNNNSSNNNNNNDIQDGSRLGPGSHAVDSTGFSFSEVGCLKASSSKVVCCHFSPDGKLLASAGHDKKAMVWSTGSLQLQSTMEEHSALITDVRFSPCSTRLATSSFDTTVRVWDVDNPTASLCTLQGHRTAVMSLDFHPVDEDLLYSCDGDSEVRCWSVSKGSCIRMFKGATTQLRFQPHRGRLLAAAADNVVSIFDAETDISLHTLSRHTKSVHSVCWDPTGNFLASVSEDSVRVWALGQNSDGECVHNLVSSGNKFHSCVFHPKYTSILVIGCYQALELWNMVENKSMTVQAHDGLVAALAQSTTTGMMASASHDKTLKIWS